MTIAYFTRRHTTADENRYVIIYVDLDIALLTCIREVPSSNLG